VIDAAKDFATLQAFIVGRLPDAERRAFEERLVREPALVSELEQSLRMREGLRHLRSRDYFTDAAPQRARFRPWVPALAAAATLVIALFLWLSRATTPAPVLLASLESHAAAGATSLVAAHFTFVSMRGSSVPNLDLPSAGLIEFRAAPISDPTIARYRVTLVRQQEGTVATPVGDLAGVTLGADGYLHCYADAARLVAGSYLLRIQPDTNTASTEEAFPFNLRPHATDPAR
jgi:anti-sigma factor RsiW